MDHKTEKNKDEKKRGKLSKNKGNIEGKIEKEKQNKRRKE